MSRETDQYISELRVEFEQKIQRLKAKLYRRNKQLRAACKALAAAGLADDLERLQKIRNPLDPAHRRK